MANASGSAALGGARLPPVQDEYARRLRRVAASTPAAAVSADLKTMLEVLDLHDVAASGVLAAPDSDADAVRRACMAALRERALRLECIFSTDGLGSSRDLRALMRACALGDESSTREVCSAAMAWLAAAAANADAEDLDAEDLDAAYFRSVLVLGIAESQLQPGAAAPPFPADHDLLFNQIRALSAWWTSREGRLGAQQSRVTERAVRDLRLALLHLASHNLLESFMRSVRRGVEPDPAALREKVALYEEMLTVAPEALAIAALLATTLRSLAEPRRAHEVAMLALPLAEAAGRGYVALRLEEQAASALMEGALAPTWSLAEVRPLAESMRRRADAAKVWLPAQHFEACEFRVLNMEAELAAVARIEQPGARFTVCRHVHRMARISARQCANCPHVASEMPRCGRCRAVW